MDGALLDTLIKAVVNFGISGIVLIIWYKDQKTIQEILKQYREDMLEQRAMYASNVELVKTTQVLARDLKDVVILNSQAWMKTYDTVQANQFCPNVRLNK